MTNQPTPTCAICNAPVAGITTWPGPYGKGLIVVGNCPECGPDSPVQMVSQIDAQPIPQIVIATGPQAA